MFRVVFLFPALNKSLPLGRFIYHFEPTLPELITGTLGSGESSRISSGLGTVAKDCSLPNSKVDEGEEQYPRDYSHISRENLSTVF